MKYQFAIAIIACSAILFPRCTNSQKPLSIIPLNMLNSIDTIIVNSKPLIYKADYYLVQGYSDSKTSQEYIDRFVEKNKDTNNLYTNYAIIFFKESSKTNVKNILANRRVIDRYSNEHDWIYKYSWSKGKFLARWKMKDGEIIEPKNDIQIIDIPDTLHKKE